MVSYNPGILQIPYFTFLCLVGGGTLVVVNLEFM